MKNKIRKLISLSLICAASIQAEVKLEAQFWSFDTDADASIGNSRDVLRDINLADSLGTGGNEATLQLRGIIGDTHQAELVWLGVNVSGSDNIEVDSPVRGIPLSLRTKIDTTFDGTFVRAAYRYAQSIPGVDAAFILGLQYVDADTDFQSQAINLFASGDSLMPVIGVYARINPLPGVNIQASVVTTNIDINDTITRFTDLELGANFSFLHSFYGGIGFHIISAEFEDDSENIDLEIKFTGPMIYAGLNW